MIPEQDNDFHTEPGEPEPAQPGSSNPHALSLYILTLEWDSIRLASVPMAMRYFKRVHQVNIRLVQSSSRLPVESDGTSFVRDVALLIEADSDDLELIKQFCRLLLNGEPQVVKATRAQVEESFTLEPEEATSARPSASQYAGIEPHLLKTPVPKGFPIFPPDRRDGSFCFAIRGDVHPADVTAATRFASQRFAVEVGVQSELDWSMTTATPTELILTLDEDKEEAVEAVADLVCTDDFTVSKVEAPSHSKVQPAPPGPAKTQQASTPPGQLPSGSNLLLGTSGQEGPASKPSSEAVEQKPKSTQSKESLPRVSAASVSGPFLGFVPDFVRADWEQVAPQSKQRRRGRSRLSYGWLVHMLVIQQKSARVIIPDVLLAQAIWGGRGNKSDWPANWRDDLVRLLGGKQTPLQCVAECTPECPIHDRSVKGHTHFHAKINRRIFLGALEHFGYEDENGDWRYDFSKGRDPVSEGQIERLRKTGRITSVYLPLLLFGPTERMKLPSEQHKLLRAITHELTRGYRSSRPDGAKIITGGKKPDGVYSGLKPGQSYVAFNGNAPHPRKHLRGYGYRLIGSTGKGWLHRAGYTIPEDGKGPWRVVARFLKDLDALAARFGLIAAGWHRHDGAWRSLAEMRSMVKNQDGRRWLKGCVLRIYTAADYLTRWRRHFAEQMGFTSIPGGEVGDAVVSVQQSTAIRSASELDKWMNDLGLTTPELAKMLGMSERWVRYQRYGTKPWSRKFEKDMESVVQQISQASK